MRDSVAYRSSTSAADRNGRREGTLVLGISGSRRNAAVAASLDGTLVGVCEQERVTRIRGVGLQPGVLPTEAIGAVLGCAGGLRASDVDRFVTAEEDIALPADLPAARLDHHLAHAIAAAHVSPFGHATVLVCDRHRGRHTSVWSAAGGALVDRHWPAGTVGLASLYSECAAVFGLPPGQEHQLEALARLDSTREDPRLERLFGYRDGVFWADVRWKAAFADWLREPADEVLAHRGRVAGAFQRHLGRLLIALVRDVRSQTESSNLCLGGGLFYNTYFNTLVHQSGIFDRVFVAPNPGNAGVAVGAAVAGVDASGPQGVDPMPFLGPEYDLEDVKRTLDNCKLSYRCLSEGEVLSVAVDALKRGRLVGWFQGRMESGHRALGHRSILASPVSEYVLENLNVYLKHRQRYRAYGLSVPESDAPAFFAGPRASRFMEYEYRLNDPERLRHVLPRGVAALRVQTIPTSDEALRRFELLHRAFGEATGIPVLVNTSFNGFSEPIVCSPRDAVRVFFGTGLDVLVLDRFVVQK